MKKNHAIIILIIYSFIPEFVLGQGCSDAGICTLNNMKPAHSDSTVSLNNQFKAGAFFGGADYLIFIWGNYLEYNRNLTENFSINAKLTSLAQNGNGINAFGAGDLFLTGNYATNIRLKFTTGVKIPLTNGNYKKNNLPLPMDYQSSLGTTDLIIGIGYAIKKLQLVFAIQQPFIQNENEFIAQNYPATSILSTFQTTNKFIRSGDILLRISYPFKLSKQLNITPSILPIYHLSNDKFTDVTGTKTEIIGSEGLTLNGNIYLDYHFSANGYLQLNMGTPFIYRSARPDGLTRAYVFNLEYGVKF